MKSLDIKKKSLLTEERRVLLERLCAALEMAIHSQWVQALMLTREENYGWFERAYRGEWPKSNIST